jgi:hypothetical protein
MPSLMAGKYLFDIYEYWFIVTPSMLLFRADYAYLLYVVVRRKYLMPLDDVPFDSRLPPLALI